MLDNNTNHALHDASTPLDVVFASGGSRAILAGTGALLAFHVLGLNNWRTIGGVSGGSIPALMLADGRDPWDCLRVAIETDFAGKLIPRTGPLRRLLALVFKYRHEITLPRHGVFSAKPLEDFVNRNVSAWPARYWTIASSRSGHILFTAGGAFRFDPRSHSSQPLSPNPPPLGTAICASCAVPGIVDAVEFQGEHLFDGAIRPNGQCPTDVVLKHFGGRANTTVAFDVGEDSIKNSFLMRVLWRLACLGRCGPIFGTHPDGADGTIVINPEPSTFHALKFNLSPDEKWHCLIGGFIATVQAMTARVKVGEQNIQIARAMAGDLARMVQNAKRPGQLAVRAHEYLHSVRSRESARTLPLSGTKP